MKNTFFYSLMLMLLWPSISFGQTEKIERLIKNEFDSIRNGSVKTNDYQFSSSNERYFLNFLRKYENDSIARIRFIVRVLKCKIAMQSNDTLVVQQVIEDLTNDISDTESNISQYALSRLLFFKQKDFSLKAKKNILKFYSTKRYGHDLFLLIGIVQLKELIPQLKQQALSFDRSTQNWYSTTAWFSTLALLRMNEDDNLDKAIAAVELEVEPVLRVTKLLKLMAYTKNNDCIKLLRKYLESYEKLPEMDKRPGTAYNQYALEFLATYLDNFPIKAKGAGYSKEEIETAKEYLEKLYK